MITALAFLHEAATRAQLLPKRLSDFQTTLVLNNGIATCTA